MNVRGSLREGPPYLHGCVSVPETRRRSAHAQYGNDNIPAQPPCLRMSLALLTCVVWTHIELWKSYVLTEGGLGTVQDIMLSSRPAQGDQGSAPHSRHRILVKIKSVPIMHNIAVEYDDIMPTAHDNDPDSCPPPPHKGFVVRPRQNGHLVTATVRARDNFGTCANLRRNRFIGRCRCSLRHLVFGSIRVPGNERHVVHILLRRLSDRADERERSPLMSTT
ncbi:hypothetical protein J6590_026957 [Homalodisca vitripennis]|nr:hypothetical protein J6590_026957 [Homalodisca vitripennis]